MLRRHLPIIPAALFAVLLVTGTALAGGWATVSINQPPTDVTVGVETNIEMTVLQHGQTPVSWPRITVVATNEGAGTVVRFEAHPVANATGLYEATLVFPSDGSWNLSYESPDLVMDGSATLDVAIAAQGAAALVTNSSLVLVALAVVGLLFLVTVAAVAIRRRGARRNGRLVTPIETRNQPLASGG